MNPNAILALLSDLYAQNANLTVRIDELETQVADLTPSEEAEPKIITH